MAWGGQASYNARMIHYLEIPASPGVHNVHVFQLESGSWTYVGGFLTPNGAGYGTSKDYKTRTEAIAVAQYHFPDSDIFVDPENG